MISYELNIFKSLPCNLLLQYIFKRLFIMAIISIYRGPTLKINIAKSILTYRSIQTKTIAMKLSGRITFSLNGKIVSMEGLVC